MITKMNYLLLITVMIAVIDNSYGRCCPCEKKNGEKAEKKEGFIDEGTGIDSQSNDNLENNLINNVGKTKSYETIKKGKNDKDGNESLENPQNAEKDLIKQIVKEAIENDIICGECEKTNSSKIKIVFDYHVARTSGSPSLKTFDLEFGFCEKHKRCHYCKKKKAVVLCQCGQHRLCQDDYYSYRKSNKKPVVCQYCGTLLCGLFFKDGFDTHIKCNKVGKEHYACFKNKDRENPYKNNKEQYWESFWLCPEHEG